MLDEFVYGEVSRFRRKQPAPVIAVQRSESNVGGAGNVARILPRSAGACIFAGLIGDDRGGAKLKALLAQESRIEPVLVCDPGRPTTRKVRFFSEHFFSTHMLRADWELRKPAAAGIEQKLIDAILPQLAVPISCCCPTMPRRADGERDPQHHRRREKNWKTRHRRSKSAISRSIAAPRS